jgi:hypothetical protein
MVITNDYKGYRWFFGMKTKDKVFNALGRWYSDITVLSARHNILVVMRARAGENRLQELSEFFEFGGVQNYYSTLYEQW